MKGKIEPLDEWLSKVEMALQQPLAVAEEEPPPPPPQQPPVAVPSMPKKRSNRHGQTISKLGNPGHNSIDFILKL